MKIAAQMYTLHDLIGSPDELARALEKVRALGYEYVQASSGAFESLDGPATRKLLDDAGLKCAASHRSLEALRDVPALIDYHEALECKYTSLGGFGWGGVSQDAWLAFAEEFSEIARNAAKDGVRVGYHNHAHDFSPFGLADQPEAISPKRTPMELLLDKCDPTVWFELDTYWVQAGGGDPVSWIERCAGRIPVLHAKDMTASPDMKPVMCEVGAGNLNWKQILPAAQKAGVEYVCVERDHGDVDPYESLRISRDNLEQMLEGVLAPA
ncbi:MAG: sugar phosphate isomerase/epimerase [Planctomycetota bacterium]